MKHDDPAIKKFAQALKEWAESPVEPRQTESFPGPERELHTRSWSWMLSRAGVAGLLGLVVWLGLGLRPKRDVEPPIATDTVVAVEEDQLLLWLDDQTPLYLALADLGEE